MIFDMPDCGGCRTCEIACSFKHTGEFAPSISSLRVLEKEYGEGYEVLLVEETQGKNIACDGCPEVDEPFCVQYCRESETLAGMVKELVASKSNAKKAGQS